MINEISGEIFSIAKENQPVAGCTISKCVFSSGGFSVIWFSLAKNTDISAEIYLTPKIWFVLEGEIEAFGKNLESKIIKQNEIYITPCNVPIGAKSKTGAVYAEIQLKENTKMNEILKSKEVFSLKDLIPYQDGKIVNMDLINNEKLKFVLMSFAKGTGLTEHAAPGEAIIFALDGNGIIGYEGKEYKISAGENFKFDKGGMHYVKADGKFKIALLLTLE